MNILMGSHPALDVLKMSLMQDDSFIVEYGDTPILRSTRVSTCGELGFKLSRFLWILKGANSLESISYYDNKIKLKSDDDHTLRGAYGPRLRFWIGADQLQEAINKNSNIDDPMDFTKPKGVDQLNKAFKDLKDGMITSGCVVFDPSLDFEDSNDIPDLYSIVFKKFDNRLDLFANYGTVKLSELYVNDCFFLFMLHICYQKLLGCTLGSVFISIANTDKDGIIKNQCEHINCDECGVEPFHLPDHTDEEKFWKDIFNLYNFEKHMRCAIYKDSINSPQIALKEHCFVLEEKFIDPIESVFWKDYGTTLMICALKRYGKIKYDSMIETLVDGLSSFLRKEVIACLAYEDKNGK